MTEVWKDIQGYEGIYQVSNLGNVRSLDRIEKWYGSERPRKGRVMATKLDKNCYLVVGLRNGTCQKLKRVHRLVAEAFIPNPNNLPEVNHKDENKANNAVSNLEWCNTNYNVRYGTGIERRSRQKRKKVIQCDLNCAKIREFDSITEAAKSINKGTSRISACCKGIRKTAYGYIWRYKEAE